MNWTVINKDNLAGIQLRSQNLCCKEGHRLTINRPWNAQRRTHTVKSDGADRRDIFAPLAGHVFNHSLARLSTTVKSRKPKIAAHFIHKDEFLHVELGNFFAERLALFLVSFAGHEAF